MTVHQLRQRADYTYKFNTETDRHGWLRLTPAYSMKIVDELIVEHPKARCVFDPFCGTGTTTLSAAYHGHDGVTTDINPFLIWFAKTKTAHYSARDIVNTQDACKATLGLMKRKVVNPIEAPPIHNIERWWKPESLEFLCSLQAAIDVTTRDNSSVRSLLQVAFCRTLIQLSNVAFNHQSMSFKSDGQLTLNLEVDWDTVFNENVRFVLQGAIKNPSGMIRVLLGDSRDPHNIVQGPFDLVVTSPPYANRMSYIRELRPYMYWLGFLLNGRDAGELDWNAIGGTWGIATSRLTGWERSTSHFESEHLIAVLDKIAHSDNKNGIVLANYVAKYFDDMWQHFQGLTRVLAQGAEVHYIVGNSTFYGSLVATEQFYAEMLQTLGFDAVQYKPIRKRNSKKELVEFDVTGKWNR